MEPDRRLALAAAAAALAGAALAPSAAHAAHPRIQAAITALSDAKAEMQAAATDFGGHRVKAIEACDRAIRQLEAALNWANAHGG
jgi:hypothetical protein